MGLSTAQPDYMPLSRLPTLLLWTNHIRALVSLCELMGVWLCVVCLWCKIQSSYLGPLWAVSGLWKAWSGISGLRVCTCWRVLVLLHGLLHMWQRNRHKACTPWVTAKGTEQRLYDFKMCIGDCVLVFNVKIIPFSVVSFWGGEGQVTPFMHRN